MASFVESMVNTFSEIFGMFENIDQKRSMRNDDTTEDL